MKQVTPFTHLTFDTLRWPLSTESVNPTIVIEWKLIKTKSYAFGLYLFITTTNSIHCYCGRIIIDVLFNAWCFFPQWYQFGYVCGLSTLAELT
jgi:hypothetical protein